MFHSGPLGRNYSNRLKTKSKYSKSRKKSGLRGKNTRNLGYCQKLRNRLTISEKRQESASWEDLRNQRLYFSFQGLITTLIKGFEPPSLQNGLQVRLRNFSEDYRVGELEEYDRGYANTQNFNLVKTYLERADFEENQVFGEDDDYRISGGVGGRGDGGDDGVGGVGGGFEEDKVEEFGENELDGFLEWVSSGAEKQTIQGYLEDQKKQEAQTNPHKEMKNSKNPQKSHPEIHIPIVGFFENYEIRDTHGALRGKEDANHYFLYSLEQVIKKINFSLKIRKKILTKNNKYLCDQEDLTLDHPTHPSPIHKAVTLSECLEAFKQLWNSSELQDPETLVTLLAWSLGFLSIDQFWEDLKDFLRYNQNRSLGAFLSQIMASLQHSGIIIEGVIQLIHELQTSLSDPRRLNESLFSGYQAELINLLKTRQWSNEHCFRMLTETLSDVLQTMMLVPAPEDQNLEEEGELGHQQKISPKQKKRRKSIEKRSKRTNKKIAWGNPTDRVYTRTKTGANWSNNLDFSLYNFRYNDSEEFLRFTESLFFEIINESKDFDDLETLESYIDRLWANQELEDSGQEEDGDLGGSENRDAPEGEGLGGGGGEVGGNVQTTDVEGHGCSVVQNQGLKPDRPRCERMRLRSRPETRRQKILGSIMKLNENMTLDLESEEMESSSSEELLGDQNSHSEGPKGPHPWKGRPSLPYPVKTIEEGNHYIEGSLDLLNLIQLIYHPHLFVKNKSSRMKSSVGQLLTMNTLSFENFVNSIIGLKLQNQAPMRPKMGANEQERDLFEIKRASNFEKLDFFITKLDPKKSKLHSFLGSVRINSLKILTPEKQIKAIFDSERFKFEKLFGFGNQLKIGFDLLEEIINQGIQLPKPFSKIINIPKIIQNVCFTQPGRVASVKTQRLQRALDLNREVSIALNWTRRRQIYDLLVEKIIEGLKNDSLILGLNCSFVLSLLKNTQNKTKIYLKSIKFNRLTKNCFKKHEEILGLQFDKNEKQGIEGQIPELQEPSWKDLVPTDAPDDSSVYTYRLKKPKTGELVFNYSALSQYDHWISNKKLRFFSFDKHSFYFKRQFARMAMTVDQIDQIEHPFVKLLALQALERYRGPDQVLHLQRNEFVRLDIAFSVIFKAKKKICKKLKK